MATRRFLTPHYPHLAFIDTGAFYALADSREPNHLKALKVKQDLAQSRTRLLLSNFIRAETHALVLNRLGHYAADQFLIQLRQMPQGTLVPVTAADERNALLLIEQYKDKDFSITDATSFVIMERLHITHAFTFDSNFRQYGFTMLPSP